MTRDEEIHEQTAQLFCWCTCIALREHFQIGEKRRKEWMRHLDATMRGLSYEQGRMAAEYALHGQDVAGACNRGTQKANAALRALVEQYCDPWVCLPTDRAPRNRRERMEKANRNGAASMAWQLMACSIHDAFGFGRDRLERLKRLTLNEWEKFQHEKAEDGDEVAYEHLRRYLSEMLQEEVTIEDATMRDGREMQNYLDQSRDKGVKAAAQKRLPKPAPAAMEKAQRILDEMQNCNGIRLQPVMMGGRR